MIKRDLITVMAMGVGDSEAAVRTIYETATASNVVMRAVLLLAALAASSTVGKAAAPERIPFIPGLTVVSVGSESAGDYEVLRTLAAVTDKGYRLVTSGEVPADEGNGFIPLSLARNVRAVDQLYSRNVRLTWPSADRENMSGNVPGISCVIFDELRKWGKSEITYLYVTALAGIPVTSRKLHGVLTVVDRKPYAVLVNRTRTALPALHVSGALSDAELREPLELFVNDDFDNPLVLRARFQQTELLRVASIEFPLPADALEQKLAAAPSVELSGIHFQFASATLRPESDAQLRQLAGVLKGHADWQFRIDGHTDSIGTSAANLELSEKRAAAVRAALTQRFGVAPGQLTARGRGETQPKESNDTDSGRARNRRVELVRLNPNNGRQRPPPGITVPQLTPGSACASPMP